MIVASHWRGLCVWLIYSSRLDAKLFFVVTYLLVLARSKWRIYLFNYFEIARPYYHSTSYWFVDFCGVKVFFVAYQNFTRQKASFAASLDAF